MQPSTKQNLIHLSVLLIVVGGMLIFEYYSFNAVKQDYNAKILQSLDAIKGTKAEIIGSINALEKSTHEKIGMVNSDLNSYKATNKESIDNLNSLIGQIEEQSNLQLQELKSDIRDIQIQSADFSGIVDDVLKSTVSVVTNKGLGSGAVIREGGFVITNYHVVQGAGVIKIDTYDEERLSVVIAGIDAAHDVAVLKVDKELPSLEFGDSDEVKVGSKVIALGNPAGLQFTVTEGIISAAREFNGVKYLQHDVSINPGNSGGPLVNQKGEIIGINNFKVGGLESLGFAIASNEVYAVANSIIDSYNAQK